MDSVLRGDFSGTLPKQDTNLVRVFLSSTFGDFTEERNKLARETFPRLQKYCQALGLEFQVVDMRWGVRDENISYHQTSEVCIQEVHNCQRLSIGPSFVALIGDRYGYRPFPAQIPKEEFELFEKVGVSQGIDTFIVSKWYKLDMNTLNKVYQLLPITHYYPNYSSKDRALMAVDRDGWWHTFLELQRTLWALVKAAVAHGLMAAERAHIYLQSVTEDEISHGIFQVANPNESCLCYTRTISDLAANLNSKLANKYIDLSSESNESNGRCLDIEAQQLLHELKFKKLPAALKSHSYTITWSSEGVNESIDEHKEYLDQLCTQIYQDTKTLIDRALITRGNLKRSALHTEVLHHASLCHAKAKSYCDRGDDAMKQIERFVTGTISKPLIVYGQSGSGKTSVVAKVVQSLKSWTGETGFTVFRFLGTSPLSSSIREVLISICEQVCTLYGIAPPLFHELDALGVTQYFKNKLMSKLDRAQSNTLYLILDSIDQLSPSDGAHSMKWLPLVTSPRVKIIVSMLSEGYNCFGNVQAVLPFCQTNYIKVGAIPLSAGLHIMNKWLLDIGRTINQEQNALITEAFLCCPQPLFLKLLFGRARTWKSYTSVKSIESFPKSTHEALNDFYRILEEYFGRVLVEKALGYLTASKEGITEIELEHILSLDNEVLNDVYQYWDPPLQGVVRIPSLLWKRIHHFIADYIVEQLSGGMTVMVWYHRQFNESAKARYVNEKTEVLLHSNLAEFFYGLYGNGKGKSVRLSHRDLDLINADRRAPSQPLKFGNVYNYRKLNELPFHLLHSNQIHSLKASVLCNFDWMYTQLKASGYSKLMRDYIDALKMYAEEEEIRIVSEMLSLSNSSLQIHIDMLAGQLLGRMLRIQSTVSSILQQLIQRAKDWINEYKDCIFQPLNNCLISPGGELKVTVRGHPHVILGIKKSPTSPILVSLSKSEEGSLLQVWSITSLECIEVISTLKQPDKEVLSRNNFVIVGNCVAAITASSYMLWNMGTGAVLDQFKSDEQLTCIAATGDGQFILIATSNGQIRYKKPSNLLQTNGEMMSNDAIVSVNESILSMDLTPDNCTTVAMLANNTVAFIDNISQQLKQLISLDDLEISTSTITHIAESFSGIFLFVSGTENGSIHIWDMSTLKSVSASAHVKAIKCITHVTSSNALITGSLDRLLKVWDMRTVSLLRVLEGHVDGVWCVDALPGKSFVVSGSKDDYLKVWDVETGNCLHTLEGHSSWISCVCAVSSNIIASGSNDKNIKIWSLSKITNAFDSTKRHVAQPECVKLVSSTLAASGGPDAMKLWNPLNGECYMTLKSPTSCLMFNSDRGILISGTHNGTIEVHDYNSNFSPLYSTQQHSSKVTHLLTIAKKVVSASLDSTVIVWNENMHVETVLQGHTSGITCIALSRTQNILATGSSDSCVRLWDLRTNECLETLRRHCKTVNCISFSNNDMKLVTGSDDKTVRVWNISDFQCLWSIKYEDSIKVISFVTDEIFLAGAHSSKKQLKSWSMETGECVREFDGHTHAVMCMLFIEDHHIVTGSRDGTIRVWNSNSGIVLSCFDLQSQVKHISAIKMSTINSLAYLIACTTKTGPIAFLKTFL